MMYKMRSLALKLVLAFLVVSLTGTALMAILARRTTEAEFDRYILSRTESEFVTDVTAYYQRYGSWNGVAEYVRDKSQAQQTQPPASPGQPPVGQSGREPQVLSQRQPRTQTEPPPPCVLVDQDRAVVVPVETYRAGDQVSEAEVAQGIPIIVGDQTVGTALLRKEPPDRDQEEERYLARMNRAFLYAAFIVSGIALLLALVLARTLALPMQELAAAARAIASGDLAHQVSVRGNDEVGELAKAFNQMSADLAQADEQRRQITADIAHDLRTPLTVLIGYLDSMRAGVLKPSPARFETMYSEARQLQHLVEDLRTLSLADAGELSLNCEPTSPHVLLEQLTAAYRHQAEQQGIVLCVQAEPTLPKIYVDPDRMIQVLGNLLSNALRYTPEGGQITLSADIQADRIHLSVEDTGTGIAPRDLPHVFDRFYRGEPSRQQQDGESGLGLAIAKSIVEAHKGTICVESEVGSGTRFTVVLLASS